MTPPEDDRPADATEEQLAAELAQYDEALRTSDAAPPSSLNPKPLPPDAGLVVLGPDGESIGRVRDAAISIRYDRQQPRVLGLIVELPDP